jgi:hypothetical protein
MEDAGYRFDDDGKRLIVRLMTIDGFVTKIYYAVSGLKTMELLEDQGKTKYMNFDIHSATKKIFIVSKELYGETQLKIFNSDDANLIIERRISEIKLSQEESSQVHFSSDGQNVIILDSDKKRLTILNNSNLQPAQGTKLESVYLGRSEDDYSKPIIYWRDRNDVKLWHVSKGEPILLKNIKLGDKDKLSSSADMQRAVIWGPQRPFELWDVKEKKLLRLLTSSKDKHIQSVAFSMNDTAVVITEEGGVASLFDAKDGSPLAQHISAASVYYYDPELRRIHAWNSSGQVLRYVEGRSYFGKFVPTKQGAQD